MTGQGRALTRLYRVYRLASRVLVPFAYWFVSRKLKSHDVPAVRIHERLGQASLPRPTGRLIWFHAASVGESLSVLTLIARMGERLPDASFLITSGTATSAELIAKRLPPRTRHQFAPLDAPGPLDQFYAHWRPDAGIFVESELWPNMLIRGHAKGTRMALLNARLSDKSVEGWRKWPDTARLVLDVFEILLTQNRKNADNLIAMGADPARVQSGVNLKSTSAPLPVDKALLNQMHGALSGRLVWLASSTHPGEEAVVLAAHRKVLAAHPDLCLILVPRHPERGDEVAEQVKAADLSSARRSTGDEITAGTQVYLADTLGETGTWYALSPIVFLGGSLQPIGGHNPYEPAQAGAALIAGPHVANFAETYAALKAIGAVAGAEDANELAQIVLGWLNTPAQLDHARTASKRFAQTEQAGLNGVVQSLCAALDLG
jgi:3-deoxy-D-manno-octulosonic-acid transferase